MRPVSLKLGSKVWVLGRLDRYRYPGTNDAQAEKEERARWKEERIDGQTPRLWLVRAGTGSELRLTKSKGECSSKGGRRSGGKSHKVTIAFSLAEVERHVAEWREERWANTNRDRLVGILKKMDVSHLRWFDDVTRRMGLS